MTGSSTGVVTVTNPFVGPRPIDTGQKIFGRDREIEQVYYLLSGERIVLLHSPSGAGKSSLIQAGLLPRLTQLFDVWGPTRVNLQPPEGDLAGGNRYVRSANLGFEARIPRERQRLPELISAMTLSEYVAGRPRRRSAPPNIVLLFDQFEEVLTVDPLALDAKREFFEQVGKLLQDPRIWALFALREDYLAPLDPYAEQVPTHLKNRYRLDLLGREAAREAISRSVEEGGRSFVPEAVGKLVNDLATMHVQSPDGTFESQTGPYVEPLHLQVACRGLWERLPEDRRTIDVDDIQSYGDVTKALAEYYEREVAAISGGDVRVARALREWVGGKLITPDGIRGQVLRGAGESEGLDNALISRLVDTHLVRGEQRAGAVWYELAHDRLIEPVRKNNSAWLEANLSMLQRDAAVWKDKGRPSALLMRGGILRTAERWARERHSELTPVERDFLAACCEVRSARYRWLATLTLVSLIAAVAIFVAITETNSASRRIKRADVDSALASKNLAAAAKRIREAVDKEKTAEGLASSEAASAQAQGARAEEQSRQARVASANLLAAQANDSAEKYPQRALLLAVEALNVNVASDPRTSAAEQALRDALASSGGRGVGGHDGTVTDVAISPNDRWLVTMSSAQISAGDVGSNMTSEVHVGQLWDLTAKNFVGNPTILENARGPVVISSDAHWLVTDGCLVDLSLKTPVCQAIHLNPERSRLSGLAVTPDNHWLISAAPHHSAVLWDLTENIPRVKPRDLKLGGHTFAVSPDGHWLVTGANETCSTYGTESSEAYLWDLKAKDPEAIVRPLTGHVLSVTSAVFSPDNHWLITASGCYVTHTGKQDTAARVWNLEALVPTANPTVLDGHGGPIESIAVSDDSRYAATGGGGGHLGLGHLDATVRVWALTKGVSDAEIHVLRGHEQSVDGLVFSHDGHWLLTYEKEGSARIWNLSDTHPEATSRVLSSKEGLPLKISEIAVSPGNRWLAIPDGSTVRVLDLALGDPTGARILRGHDATVTSVAFSPNGKWMATGSTDKTARLWDLPADRSLAGPVVLNKSVTSWHENRLSPDGKLAVGAGDNGTPRVSDPSTGRTVSELRGANVRSTAFSGDDRLMVTVASDNGALLWEPSSGQKKRTLPSNQNDPIRRVAISANGQIVLAVGRGIAKVWEATRSQPIAELPHFQQGRQQQISSAAISPDGLLVITTDDYDARLWDVRAASGGDKTVHNSLELRKDEHQTDVRERPVRNALFSPDGKVIVVIGGNSARLWDSSSKTSLGIMRGVGTSAAFSADGSRLVTSSGDQTARVWKLPPTNGNFESVELEGHTAEVLSAGFSPDGRLVATGSDDKTARIWDASTGHPLRVLQGHKGSVNRVAFSGDGRFLFTASGEVEKEYPSSGPKTFDRTVRAWEVATWKQVAELHGDIAAFSHDGRFAVMANDDHAAWIWETSTGHILAELRGDNGNTVTTAAFSPDATLVATGNQDGSSRVWKAATGQLLQALSGHDGAVSAISFSPDSKLLVTASEDNAARVWRRETGRSQLLKHTSPVSSAAFSPDGRLVATGSRDNTVRIWSMSSEEMRTTPIILRGYSEPSDIAFSPDGHWLLAHSEGKTYGWNLQISELAALACQTAGRNLTASEWAQYFPGQPYRRTCPSLSPGDSVPLSPHTPTGLPITGEQSHGH